MNLKEQFENMVNDTPFPIPLNYYGKLQSLAGAVYDYDKDEEMDEELNALSKYIQRLIDLKEFEDHISNLIPREMDYRHFFDTGLDYRHQNLNQVSITFPEQISFPEQQYQPPETLIKAVVEKFHTKNSYNFNTAKIIAWIRTKMNA